MIDLICFRALNVERVIPANGGKITDVITRSAFDIYINPAKVVLVSPAYADYTRDREMTCITFEAEGHEIIVGASLNETLHRLRGEPK